MYWDDETEQWNTIPDFIDVLRDTYNICYEAYTEAELIEVIKDILRKELLHKY